ncbi:MAG: hypothetical protein CSA07_00445 [Bacteroidia bacterium]|nr:MAG: hypothetical protein CSA07_00445 [Bacteroidia bacterium]
MDRVNIRVELEEGDVLYSHDYVCIAQPEGGEAPYRLPVQDFFNVLVKRVKEHRFKHAGRDPELDDVLDVHFATADGELVVEMSGSDIIDASDYLAVGLQTRREPLP